MTTEADRELLKFAAKAAGFGFDGTFTKHPTLDGYSFRRKPWNPITDDGDALRLAVKLRLTIKHDDPSASMAGIAADQDRAPTLDGKGPWYLKEWNNDSDPYVATRRAIVRSAAEIGKAMK